MEDQAGGLPTRQELYELRLRSILDFIHAAQELAIIDDSECMANLPGFPVDQWAIKECAYYVLVTYREDYYEQETRDDSESWNPFDSEDDSRSKKETCEVWFDILADLLIRRWGWWDYLQRFPLCYPNSFAEISERYREIDLADTPEYTERHKEIERMHALHIFWKEDQADFYTRETQRLDAKYENDPAMIVSGWLLGCVDLPDANLTRAELAALTEIRKGLTGSEEDLTEPETDSCGRSSKRTGKRNQGKANQARGVFIAHVELVRDGKTNDPPPSVAEIARQVGCSKATASRATQELRAKYESFLRPGSLKGYKTREGSLDAWDDDRDEE